MPTETSSITTKQPQTSTLPPATKGKVTKSHSFGSTLPQKWAANSNPVAVGATGTVGSLIMQEIEYFNQIEVGGCSSSSNPPRRLADAISSATGLSKPKVKPDKKKRGSNKLIPSMCSTVEVASQRGRVRGLTCTNPKADCKKLEP